MPTRSLVLLTLALTFWLGGLIDRASGQLRSPEQQIHAAADTPAPITAGGRGEINVTLDLGDELHAWPNRPIVPKELAGLDPIATTIAADPASVPAGVRVLVEQIRWPASTKVRVNFTGVPLELQSYAGRVGILVPVAIDPGTAPGEKQLTLKLDLQACNETSCFAPTTLDVPLTLTVLPGSVGAGTGVRDFGAFGLSLRIDGSTALGLGLIVLVAFVGGILLNFTPCVLPVIPIKILGLAQAAQHDRRRSLRLGIVTAAGVVMFWLVLGGLIAGAKIGAISELASYWSFNLIVGAFIGVMAVGLMGAFDVGLPDWVYKYNPSHEKPGGSFGYGIMHAVLATPCVAPLAGSAAAWAFTQPGAIIMLVFLAIGLGMSTPYLVLSANPKLLAWLPRAGPASALLKQVLGLLMLGVTIFFLGTGLIILIYEKPWLATTVHWWGVALAALVAMSWLVLRTWAITSSPGKRAFWTLLGAGFTLAGFWWASDQTGLARTLHERREPATTAAGGSKAPGGEGSIWSAYDAASYQRDLAQGKVVVLDFTAEWCLNCKVLEATVLSTPSVQGALATPGVVSYKVDLTSRQAPGWALLRELKESGIPLIVVRGPGLSEPFKSNAYTAEQLVGAIERARGK